MSNILILGASGPVGKLVATRLEGSGHFARLFVRSKTKIKAGRDQEIFEGDATDQENLFSAMEGIDLVFSNLGPYQMQGFAEPVVMAMKRRGAQRLLWTATGGIYGELDESAAAEIYAELGGPPSQKGSYLHDQRAGADCIEHSGLEYTIFRWNWLTDDETESEIVITRKGEVLKGGPISRRTVARFVKSVIDHPEQFINESLGVSGASTMK